MSVFWIQSFGALLKGTLLNGAGGGRASLPHHTPAEFLGVEGLHPPFLQNPHPTSFLEAMASPSPQDPGMTVTDRLSQMSRCPGNTDSQDSIYPEQRLYKSAEIRNYDYPIAGCWTACIPDDSDKAWGMLFESEAWPLPFRVK